ncbi:hypothetical protein B7Y92_04215 [Candidatus Saccharibacteria bacterium 32-50-13]|nr:MAG: hypothetical protein B7Y92_04215 [Candidatus Saccharibacteria bacterium 32-50-13]
MIAQEGVRERQLLVTHETTFGQRKSSASAEPSLLGSQLAEHALPSPCRLQAEQAEQLVLILAAANRPKMASSRGLDGRGMSFPVKGALRSTR